MIAPSRRHSQHDSAQIDSARRIRRRQLKQSLGLRAMLPLHKMFGRRSGNDVGILMYHRLADVMPGVPKPTWNVSPMRFREQLSGLLERGFNAWPLRKVIEDSQSGRPIPPKTFVVTFDDGYENNVTIGRTILRQLGVPATIFVATAYLDSNEPFPCDDWVAKGSSEVAAGAWRPMTSEQCAVLIDDDLIDVGCHTHTHADFRGQPDELRADIETSLDVLRTRFGQQDATFAFPYGTKHLGFSGGSLADAARQAGVLCALTTEDELVRPGSDVFDWGRFTAEDNDTATTLAAKLDGWFTFARDTWRRCRRARYEAAVNEPCVIAEA